MYFIDRSSIQQSLEYYDGLLDEFDCRSFHTSMDKLGLERIIHMLIESILDVGNMMIDGFVMRDPGSYEDIIDILVDEKVLPEQDKNGYITIIQLRNSVVRYYLTVDHNELLEAIAENKHKLKKFSTHIKAYLDNQLDVANAFSNE